MIDTMEKKSVNGMSVAKVVAPNDIILAAITNNTLWFDALIERNKLSATTIAKALASPMAKSLNEDQREMLEELQEKAPSKGSAPGRASRMRASKIGEVGEVYVNFDSEGNPFAKIDLSLYPDWKIQTPKVQPGKKRPRSMETIFVKFDAEGPTLARHKDDLDD